MTDRDGGEGAIPSVKTAAPLFPPKKTHHPAGMQRRRGGKAKNEVMCGESCNASGLKGERFRTKETNGGGLYEIPAPALQCPPKTFTSLPPPKKIPVPPSVWPRLPVATATQGHFSGISLGIVMVTAGLDCVYAGRVGGKTPSWRLGDGPPPPASPVLPPHPAIFPPPHPLQGKTPQLTLLGPPTAIRQPVRGRDGVT